jgi:hypothetical protein
MHEEWGLPEISAPQLRLPPNTLKKFYPYFACRGRHVEGILKHSEIFLKIWRALYIHGIPPPLKE